MILMPKNVHFDKLVGIVNKYNNTCHSTIKRKSMNVKSSTYINFSAENHDKDPKVKDSDHVRL